MRATQYLPDIVRLQQSLYDAFHHRLDKKDAVTQTVRDFLDKLNSGNEETVKRGQLILINCFSQKMLAMSTKRELEACRRPGH